jgi:hypothetical protein
VAPEDRTPPHPQQDTQAAAGGPVGVGVVTYAEAAERLLDNGYAPLPLAPGKKRPIPGRWSETAIDAAQVAWWSRQHPHAGVGLRTGSLVGIDIDAEDPELAHAMTALTVRSLGDTLVRVGRWPRRLLIYRTDAPFAKLSCPSVEILGKGQQFVAFGIHEKTGLPYSWLGDSPLDVALQDLPLVDESACRALLAGMAQMAPEPQTRPRRRGEAGHGGGNAPVRDADGHVTDGRDGWLSAIAYHAVHDAVDRGGPLDAHQIAAVAWRRFEGSTDLSRTKQDGDALYSLQDAAEKVADKLRLLRDGRLSSRATPDIGAPELPETHPAEAARARLDALLKEACATVEAWHVAGGAGPAPQIGVKATVGLGKSSAARRHVGALNRRLAAAGQPSRILILTPTLALADETAQRWRDGGAHVAVLRGYLASHQTSGRPMCGDHEAVRAAMDASEDVQKTACIATAERRCALFDGCLKQANRREVAEADVIVAAYDALFTGFAVQPESIGLILIDEGCWARSIEEQSGLTVEGFASEMLNAERRDPDGVADLHDLRARAVAAFLANGAGPVHRRRLAAAGLGAEAARLARGLEQRRLRDPGLFPGMSRELRKTAMRQVRLNIRSRFYIAAWDAIGRLLAGGHGADGRLEIGAEDVRTGVHPLTVRGQKPIHHTLQGKPVLHLDATLRFELARTLLPDLEVSEIAAATPNMHLRLITGPFGKGSLCDGPRADPAERQRRANRRAECVDYVRWHARRFKRTLVVTYKDIEAEFAGIPGVEVAHFNAIAGLDLYRDVGLLIVLGRPLPGTDDLARLSGTLFGHVPSDGYRRDLKGVAMRSGVVRGVRATVHADEQAEVLRAAICDDEVIQAIGRGRGVNRTADDPLEVHVLADVGLPLLHDRVSCWDIEAPDILQQMLLAGIAVDSPAHATLLHPRLFVSASAAKHRFRHSAFKDGSPIRTIYRETVLKSAAYRRPGRGRGWQRAWWVDGSVEEARAALERAIGPLDGWKLD